MKTTFLILMAFVGLSCSSQSNKSTEKEADQIAKNIAVSEFQNKIANTDGIQLLDVRTAEEFKDGFIAQAKNIDWFSENFEQESEVFDKTKPILIYCRSGNRSTKAMKKLTSLGFKEIYNLKGGMLAWQAEKMSVNKPQ